MLWEGCLFEPQTTVEWKAVMSRGAEQVNSMAILLATCESPTDRPLIHQGTAWITQGTDQQERDRVAEVKPLYSMLAATTSGRA